MQPQQAATDYDVIRAAHKAHFVCGVPDAVINEAIATSIATLEKDAEKDRVKFIIKQIQNTTTKK